MKRLGAAILAALLGAFAVSPTLAGEEARFQRAGPSSAERADWVAAGGGRTVFGAGRRVVVSEHRGEARLELDIAVEGAAVVGDAVFLVGEDRTLRRVDLRAFPGATHSVALVPTPHGRLHVAGMDAWLVVAEDGHGLTFLPEEGGPACHDAKPKRQGVLFLPESFRAIAAWGRSVYVAVRGRGVVQVDARDPAAPSIVRSFALPDEIGALEAVGSKLYVLGEHGLEILDATSGQAEVHPEIRGRALEVAGRVLRIAEEDGGLVRYRDSSPEAQLFEVAVNSDFFSPQDLTVALGDTVRWTNVTGDLHNVFSCTTTQTGCNGVASNESFTSGAATGFFVFDHTFAQAGANPYICQPHAPFMVGSVTVTGASGAPPGVPDGRSGTPMRVGKLAHDGSALSVAWDVTSCTGAADHEIVYSYAFGLPGSPGGVYEITGGRCSIGTASPFPWTGVPTAFAGSAGWVWWLVVATDGAATEGSWGKDGAGAERQGSGTGGSSGQCGIATKSLSNVCGQ